MVPKAIWDRVSSFWDVLQQLKPDRNTLISIYNKFSNPIAFVNNYMKEFPSSSRSIAGQIYSAIRYMAKQEDTLQFQPPGMQLDRRLAPQIPMDPERPGTAYGFRYNIQFNLSTPEIGTSHTFNFWIYNNALLNPQEVGELATPLLLSRVDRYKLTFSPGFPNSVSVVSTELQGFVQFNPEL